jgi:poly(rC)-binding protein 2/3/4
MFKLIRRNIWNPRCAKVQELEKDIGIGKKDKRSTRVTKKRNGKKHKGRSEQKSRQDSDQESNSEQEEFNIENNLEAEQELELENNEDYENDVQDQENQNQDQENQNQDDQVQELSKEKNVREIEEKDSRLRRVKGIVWDWIKEKKRWLGL